MTRSFDPVQAFESGVRRLGTLSLDIYYGAEVSRQHDEDLCMHIQLASMLSSESEARLWWRNVVRTLVHFASDNAYTEMCVLEISHSAAARCTESIVVLLN